MLNRRKFLASVGWSGWRDLNHQDVTFGFWAARRVGDERFLYATTLGVVGTALEGQLLNLTRMAGWPWITCTSGTPELEAVKARARHELERRLNDEGRS